ncbi:MAG: phosphatase [Chlamydiales bacterium 38-26]|nr:PHP domain-containing protein [Chlamydiales bacterium]OJV07462.1 MAG: phosphatase [Chlamydiales bacterium 38-26]
MNEFRADLHCHSTCSDGTVSPEELIRMAAARGLSGISITDHDTTEAYTNILPLAQDLGIEIISGVEFSSFLEDVSVHILAYSFPLDSPIIKNFCLRHHQRRTQRNREILKLLNTHGIAIREEDVLEALSADFEHVEGAIGRPHIALAMLKKGYVTSIQEAFNKYLAEGKPCYAPGECFSVKETLDVIHAAKGLAIIAHPHLLKHPKTLKKLLEMNFDGMECYYACFNAASAKRWLKIAQHRQWLITGGSDYHGSIKPNISLGASWVNEETFRFLKNHFQQVSKS